MTNTLGTIPTLDQVADSDSETTLVLREPLCEHPEQTTEQEEHSEPTLKLTRNNTQIKPRKKTLNVSFNSPAGIQPGTYTPLIIQYVWPLLCLTTELRHYQPSHEVAHLRTHVGQLIQTLRANLIEAIASETLTDTVSYLICALIDETVLNSHWAQRCNWAQLTLLSQFHGETQGGERVYQLLENTLQAPQKNFGLIELFYLVLSLGFKGELRLAQQGAYKHEFYRRTLSQLLPDSRREAVLADLNKAPTQPAQQRSLKWQWLYSKYYYFIVLLILVSLIIYAHLALRRTEQHTLRGLYEPLQRMQQRPETLQPTPPETLRLNFLQTEIEQGLLDVEHDAIKTTLFINSQAIFSNDSDTIKTDFSPILFKMAKLLESWPGQIIVIGGADKNAVQTQRFRSLWHLSLARASAVVSALERGAKFQHPIIPEGDASLSTKPLAQNISQPSPLPAGQKNEHIRIEIYRGGQL